MFLQRVTNYNRLHALMERAPSLAARGPFLGWTSWLLAPPVRYAPSVSVFGPNRRLPPSMLPELTTPLVQTSVPVQVRAFGVKTTVWPAASPGPTGTRIVTVT